MIMDHYRLLLPLFVISSCFITEIVAREAIVGGYLVPSFSFEYHVTIFIAGYPPRCGGGIIAKQSVVTAAHCVIEPNEHMLKLVSNDISVLAGTVDLSIAGIVIKVEKVFLPMAYTPQRSKIDSDIAVLRLKQPFEIERYGLKILQHPGHMLPSYIDYIGNIAGIGWDVIFENNHALGEYTDSHLRFAEARILNNTDCQNQHPTERISTSLLCARVIGQLMNMHLGHRRGVCVGDEGGPLVVNSKTVIGILSQSTMGCSEIHSSGIYVRISRYGTFIKKAINNTLSRDAIVFDV